MRYGIPHTLPPLTLARATAPSSLEASTLTVSSEDQPHPLLASTLAQWTKLLNRGVTEYAKE